MVWFLLIEEMEAPLAQRDRWDAKSGIYCVEFNLGHWVEGEPT
jgi:hypothetical protein